MADIKNVDQVALEAGNSPDIIFQHYRELVTGDAAKQWFGICPALLEADQEGLKEEGTRLKAEKAEAERATKWKGKKVG